MSVFPFLNVNLLQQYTFRGYYAMRFQYVKNNLNSLLKRNILLVDKGNILKILTLYFTFHFILWYLKNIYINYSFEHECSRFYKKLVSNKINSSQHKELNNKQLSRYLKKFQLRKLKKNSY